MAALLGFSNEMITMGDSYDISFELLGEEPTGIVREAIVHHSIDGTFAIRKGPWKLILGKDSGGFSKGIESEKEPVETAGQLYDLKTDPSERKNLYDQYPDKVRALTELLEKYKSSGRSRL